MINSLFILLLLLAGGYSALTFLWFGAKWAKTPKVLGCILAPVIVLSSVSLGFSIGVNVASAILGPGPQAPNDEFNDALPVAGMAGAIGGSCIGGLVGCLATVIITVLFSRIWARFVASRP
jgi:hypothetical protein